jgi:hypothetical protein
MTREWSNNLTTIWCRHTRVSMLQCLHSRHYAYWPWDGTRSTFRQRNMRAQIEPLLTWKYRKFIISILMFGYSVLLVSILKSTSSEWLLCFPHTLQSIWGHAYFVEALCYKPEGRGFESRWPNPSSRTMALRSTQPLTEMGTRNLPGGKGRPARRDDNLTAISEPIV